MTTSIRLTLRQPRSRLVLLAIAVVTIGGAAAQIAIHPGSHASKTASAPSINDRRYADSISSLTPAQLAAAFGTEPAGRTAPMASERRYAEAIAVLTPTQLAAAFGSGPFDQSVLAQEDQRYANAVASLTLRQLAAAYGSGR